MEDRAGLAAFAVLGTLLRSVVCGRWASQGSAVPAQGGPLGGTASRAGSPMEKSIRGNPR